MTHKERLVAHYGRGEGLAIYRMVMEECFALSQSDILLGKDTKLSAQEEAKLEEITCRLLKNEPIQYILGYADFCGHRFGVRPGCLIPRPETAFLVDAVLASCEARPQTSVLDIGTGSGCIAISLALAGCQVSAMDISDEALQIARENAHALGAKVDFVQENILQPQPTSAKWDIIVSNPPYIPLKEAAGMEANVLDFEPHMALFVPDDDPLLFYDAIAAYGREHLREGGKLFFEISDSSATQVLLNLESHGYSNVSVRQDQYEKDRFVQADL